MTMTSRERVLAVLNHETPDRVPIVLGPSNATGVKMGTYRRIKELIGVQAEDRYIYDWPELGTAEMDEAIQAGTGGARSLRDALNGLVARTASTGRPFTVDEFPGLVRQATGVDVTAIFDRWMRAPGH